MYSGWQGDLVCPCLDPTMAWLGFASVYQDLRVGLSKVGIL